MSYADCDGNAGQSLMILRGWIVLCIRQRSSAATRDYVDVTFSHDSWHPCSNKFAGLISSGGLLRGGCRVGCMSKQVYCCGRVFLQRPLLQNPDVF